MMIRRMDILTSSYDKTFAAIIQVDAAVRCEEGFLMKAFAKPAWFLTGILAAWSVLRSR